MCGRCRWCGRRCGGTCWTNAHRYNTYITLMNCDHFHLDGGLYLPFITGDELPLRSVRGGARLVWCVFGEIGDFGATARALSGESGVRHCMSLPAITKIKTKNRTIRNYFNLISTSTQEHKYGKRMGLMLSDVHSIKHQRKKKKMRANIRSECTDHSSTHTNDRRRRGGSAAVLYFHVPDILRNWKIIRQRIWILINKFIFNTF